MIKLEPDDVSKHFTNEELKSILSEIYNKNEEAIKSLEEDSELKCENLFNEKNKRSISNGFAIKTVVQRIKQEISIYIDEINLCEDEDEWFSIFKRLKS